MATDDPIEPINLDAPARVTPVETQGVRRPNPVPPAATTRAAPPTEELADALERSLLLEGDEIPIEPTVIEQQTDVHDAAMHGDAYARAVEQARIEREEQQPDPNSIGQVLGGAAAAAYSGQAAQIDRSRNGRDERTEHAEDVTRELDPLAPTPRVSDDDEDDRRRRARDDQEREH